jgi:transcriptional regulator with XRE-family HTH domain
MNAFVSSPPITAAQARAARGWLNISQQQLADRSLVSRRAIAQFESGASLPFERTLKDLQRAFEEMGIEFVFEGQRAVGIRGSDPGQEQAQVD